MVDCDCPDYRYRFAYNNFEVGAGILGNPKNKTGWQFHNKNIGTPPRPVSQGGVGDYGPGLCKHLCALSKFLETKFTSKAPDPKDKLPPSIKQRKISKINKDADKNTELDKEPTIQAPDPEDSYSDSRSDLQESFSANTLSKFVQENPEFEVIYEMPKDNINESNLIAELHERGEWWIDGSGEITYADGDLGDSNHESVVISYLSNEILFHFGFEVDEVGYLTEYMDEIKNVLLSSNRLTREELEKWENSKKNAALVLIEKLIENKIYSSPEQVKEAVFVACGIGSTDGRNYAMKYLGWKIMIADRQDINIQTWFLKSEDLSIIIQGIWEIMEEDDSDNDVDSKIGDDGYPGPRVTITVQSSGKIFKGIPLSLLEKKMPQLLHNYRDRIGFAESINENFSQLHKKYSLYEGTNHIIAIFEDGSRLKFEIHYRNNRGEDKLRWKRKALTTWKSCATEIHKESEGYNDVGNWVEKPWHQCFKEALKHPKMKDFIRTNPEYKVFG